MSRDAPVRVSVTTTWAPATGFPSAVETWPWMDVVICWACETVGTTAAAIGMATNAQVRNKRPFFTESTPRLNAGQTRYAGPAIAVERRFRDSRKRDSSESAKPLLLEHAPPFSRPATRRESSTCSRVNQEGREILIGARPATVPPRRSHRRAAARERPRGPPWRSSARRSARRWGRLRRRRR